MASSTDDRAASTPASGLAATAPHGPYRGRWGAARPAALAQLALPPGRMPLLHGTRPLKQWRYVGVYGPRLMLCVGLARVGVAHQSFWAVWDREARLLHERTRLSKGRVELSMEQPGRVRVADDAGGGTPIAIDLHVVEEDGVETVSPHGGAYVWTRKQGGVPARGTVRIGGERIELDGLAVVDDSAGYHARRTDWRWSAGVGRTADGRVAAWNLVDGIHDAAAGGSERTVWLDGVAQEASPALFAADLSAVSTPGDGGALRFASEAVRERRENMLLVRSSYRQPFGTFAGTLPGGAALAEGFGVMEQHSAVW
jgi:hypothetical protein